MMLVSLISSYLALNEQVLAMAADQGFWEEGSKVDHDLSEKGADGAKSHLEWKICQRKLDLLVRQTLTGGRLFKYSQWNSPQAFVWALPLD